MLRQTGAIATSQSKTGHCSFRAPIGTLTAVFDSISHPSTHAPWNLLGCAIAQHNQNHAGRCWDGTERRDIVRAGLYPGTWVQRAHARTRRPTLMFRRPGVGGQRDALSPHLMLTVTRYRCLFLRRRNSTVCTHRPNHEGGNPPSFLRSLPASPFSHSKSSSVVCVSPRDGGRVRVGCLPGAASSSRCWVSLCLIISCEPDERKPGTREESDYRVQSACARKCCANADAKSVTASIPREPYVPFCQRVE